MPLAGLERAVGLRHDDRGDLHPGDTVAAIEAKHALVSRELEAWRAVATSTDFPR